ncbi:PilC/PilY family type IV pilus protein [Azonexus sp.]|uniref:pilus assembly protein n=1 Tax=Azonexus sp. TaxID=1872668 RepID=UPI002832AA6C|nr:PilC/PilY family type IV pilus protein [Azonexus sp.]MDR1994447.1 hypothetical protein [Azonexus sp.]
MNQRFGINIVKLALCLVYPALSLPALAQVNCDDPDNALDPECNKDMPPQIIPGAPVYSSLPPMLAPAVKPNILLFIDNSGSMGSAPNGKTVTASNPDKMTIAKNVAKDLLTANRNLSWGIFSFDYGGNSKNTSATFYNEGGVLQYPVGPIDSESTEGKDRFTAIIKTLNDFTAKTNTPLAQTMIEMTRVWAGETSYNLGSGSLSTSNGNAGGKTLNLDKGTDNVFRYQSPIQYRCQRNFNILIGDGDPTQDNLFPGNPTNGNNYYVPGNGTNIKYGDGIKWQQRDVAGGPLLDKTFKVCRDLTTDSFIGCAASTYLGGADTRMPFLNSGSGNNASNNGGSGGPVRDAAKYAYMRDFKVDGIHGFDGDGKSWDDPKYPKQNVVTYAVGFGMDVKSLGAAALVGGGKYYTAENQSQLLAALNNAVSEIGNITSNAGGAATSGATFSTADKMFQPVFHPTGWYGELLCFKLNNLGQDIGSCTPNAGAVFPAHTGRNIASAKVVGGVTTPFEFKTTSLTTMTTEQQKALEGISTTATLPTSTTVRSNVINFIRGQEGIKDFRTRPNGLLADIIDGQPLTISVPSGYTSDGDYPTFKSANSSRGMVFIGANGGMLHGFTTNNMTEVFGFVPSPVYPQLKQLTDPNYGSPSAPHAYHVNGVLHQQDVKLGGVWATLLVGGLAQGGQGYFALNATSTTSLSTPATAVKWEFTDKNDPDLGYTFGSPIIYNVRTSSTVAVPAVLLANGYKSDFPDGNVGVNNSTLFIVNANDGTMLKKITAPSGWGLSSPFGVDYDPVIGADGTLDYVYAGDQSGRLWRFDLTSPIGAALPDPHLVFSAGSGHPIIQKPVVKIVKDKDGNFLGNLVIFGTGSLLETSDRLDNATQTLYAVLDRMGSTTSPIIRANLAPRVLEEAVVASGSDQRAGTYRRIEPADPSAPDLDLTDPNSDKLGWYLDLPVKSERLSTTPLLYDDRVLFGTGIPNSQEVCNTGYGWYMGLDPLTGLVVKDKKGDDFSFFDVKIDGKSTPEDMVKFPDGKSYYISGYKLDGISTNLAALVTSVAYPSFATDNTYAAGLAFYDSNVMSVATGRESSGKGSKVFVGELGSDKLHGFDPTKESSGVKVETTIWREIKWK